MSEYKHHQIEKKWQEIWQNSNSFHTEIDSKKTKFYVLEMLPYPSGKLHMGHVRNYTIGDAFARFKKANGFNVLHPMGWDAFGLPAENAAIENKTHPLKWTLENVKTMKQEFQSLGFMYDWPREITTCLPEYFKHEQEIFIDFLEKGLAYQKESLVNWDPVDNTVLANEQVIDGRGWRSGAIVEKRKLNQWFLKISDFAEELLPSNSSLENWPEAVKSIQEKWIGKSKGALVSFKITNSNESIEIFTTRADTLFGASFIVISPLHPIVRTIAHSPSIEDFIKECEKGGTSEEEIEKAEKKGIFTGIEVIHPFFDKKLPVYIANYVLMEYGTGAVFGCPAHDARDHEFATKYNLDILPVIKCENWDYGSKPYLGDGIIYNSDFLDGLSIGEAKKVAISKIQEINAGSAKTTYRLRDWGVSRQRYWGCPIPIIHCKSCGAVPVPKSSLPVTLPEDVDFSKTGNPLLNHPTWKNAKCPKCGSDAERETDTFDTFFESSWYFMRYISPTYAEAFAKKEDLNYFMPVDQYIGGIEHAAMHLLYARFFVKALNKCGKLEFTEPFKALLTQGMVLHATYKNIDGKFIYPEEATNLAGVTIGRSEKMSKSKKNTVSPVEIIKKYGADTARFFVISDSPPEKDFEWTETGVEATNKFLSRIYRFSMEVASLSNSCEQIKNINVERAIQKLLNNVTNSYNSLSLNVVIAGIREMSNVVFAIPRINENADLLKNSLKILLKILCPITPHLCNELWNQLAFEEDINHHWPQVNEALLEDEIVTIAIQVSGKLRATIEVDKNLTNEELEKIALDQPNVKKFIEGQIIKKIIIIPNKIINIVV